MNVSGVVASIFRAVSFLTIMLLQMFIVFIRRFTKYSYSIVTLVIQNFEPLVSDHVREILYYPFY